MPVTEPFKKNCTLRRSLLLLAASCTFAGFVPTDDANALVIETSDNGLRLSGEITQESPRQFSVGLARVLLEMQASGDRNSPVRLDLDLPSGGLTSASFQLVELMKTAQAHGTKFAAHIDEKATCMSGCTYLFLAANERWIAPEGKLIFHGFSQGNPEEPVEIPGAYFSAYQELLKSANKSFFDFFKAARIIEQNKVVGFTGRTLFSQRAFSGLITGLKYD